MKYFDHDAAAVGLAYGPTVPGFLESHPGVADYVEIPFELLRHAPQAASIQECLPVVLHCASMSLAGFVPAEAATLDAIGCEARRTRTPWIGEHLAFLSADALESGPPTELTYTVSPQLSEATVEQVAQNMARLAPHFDVPLIVENSPQYFAVPGSTMTMTEFVTAVAERCGAGLLLDLSHFLITACNTGTDAMHDIERLPLERVVEIHLSGMSVQSGVAWDDHAAPASGAVFALLERVLRRARPRAVTLEYNWSPHFSHTVLEQHFGRVRALLAA